MRYALKDKAGYLFFNGPPPKGRPLTFDTYDQAKARRQRHGAGHASASRPDGDGMRITVAHATAADFTKPGVRVRVTCGMCNGARGFTTGDARPAWNSTADAPILEVGVQLTRVFKYLPASYLMPR